MAAISVKRRAADSTVEMGQALGRQSSSQNAPLLQHEDHEDQSSHGEGIVTVVSSSDAAAYRASNVKREKPVDSNEALALQQNDRAARGEADHGLQGLLLYALSTIFMSAMMILVKLLGKWGISVFIVLVIRSVTVLLLALLNLWRDGDNPWGHRRQLLTLRGILGFGGNGGYFWTVTLLPLNDAIVLTFLAPAWVALLSPLLLKESPGKFTFMAIPACIVGVYLIAKPQTEASNHGAKLHLVGILVGLFQAFFSGTAKMCVRELRSTEVPNVIVFYLAFISSIGAITGVVCQAIFFGGLVFPHGFIQLLVCLGVGLLGYGAQISLTLGLRSAKAAPAIATSYLSVVWGILASLFIFHEQPSKRGVLGAAIIIVCTGSLAFAEKNRKKPAVPGSMTTPEAQRNGVSGV